MARSSISQTGGGLFVKKILHIVLIICVNNETESILQSFFPIVDLLLELVDVRLVADLASHDLPLEQIADRILKMAWMSS